MLVYSDGDLHLLIGLHIQAALNDEAGVFFEHCLGHGNYLLNISLENASIFSNRMRPAAAHSLRSHVCRPRREIRQVHAPANFGI
jgi:hypothetical protein